MKIDEFIKSQLNDTGWFRDVMVARKINPEGERSFRMILLFNQQEEPVSVITIVNKACAMVNYVLAYNDAETIGPAFWYEPDYSSLSFWIITSPTSMDAYGEISIKLVRVNDEN